MANPLKTRLDAAVERSNDDVRQIEKAFLGVRDGNDLETIEESLDDLEGAFERLMTIQDQDPRDVNANFFLPEDLAPEVRLTVLLSTTTTTRTARTLLNLLHLALASFSCFSLDAKRLCRINFFFFSTTYLLQKLNVNRQLQLPVVPGTPVPGARYRDTTKPARASSKNAIQMRLAHEVLNEKAGYKKPENKTGDLIGKTDCDSTQNLMHCSS